MSIWLYHLNPKDWSPETFQFGIWEGQRWHWGYSTKRGTAVWRGPQMALSEPTAEGTMDQ